MAGPERGSAILAGGPARLSFWQSESFFFFPARAVDNGRGQCTIGAYNETRAALSSVVGPLRTSQLGMVIARLARYGDMAHEASAMQGLFYLYYPILSGCGSVG